MADALYDTVPSVDSTAARKNKLLEAIPEAELAKVVAAATPVALRKRDLLLDELRRARSEIEMMKSRRTSR